MFSPHTVTIFILTEGDSGTVINSAVLENVFLDRSKASNIQKSGLQDADSATLFIPDDVGCTKTYAQPKAYMDATDKTGLWTVFDGGEMSGCDCYFIKGAITDWTGTYTQAKEAYDDVYHVTSVDVRDFGSQRMRHLQVGGR